VGKIASKNRLNRKGVSPPGLLGLIGDVYLFMVGDLLENKKTSMGNIRLRRIKVAHPTVVLKES